ncbi:MAG: hypothetical protein U0174_21775 [Polyangiaceae bacterium]
MKKASLSFLVFGGLLALGACKTSGTASSNIENESLTIEGAFEQVGDTRSHLVLSKNGTFFSTYADQRIEGRYTATHTTAGLVISFTLKDQEVIEDDPPIVDAGKDTGSTVDAGKDAGKTDAGGVVDAGSGSADAGKSDAGTKDAGTPVVDPGQTNGDDVFGPLKLTKYEYLQTGKRGTLLIRNDSGSRQYKKLPSYCIESADCSTQGLNPCATTFSCSAHACVCSKGTDGGTPKSDAGK